MIEEFEDNPEEQYSEEITADLTIQVAEFFDQELNTLPAEDEVNLLAAFIDTVHNNGYFTDYSIVKSLATHTLFATKQSKKLKKENKRKLAELRVMYSMYQLFCEGGIDKEKREQYLHIGAKNLRIVCPEFEDISHERLRKKIEGYEQIILAWYIPLEFEEVVYTPLTEAQRSRGRDTTLRLIDLINTDFNPEEQSPWIESRLRDLYDTLGYYLCG